jgi:ADP-heptose:LPS heptosyltransferase
VTDDGGDVLVLRALGLGDLLVAVPALRGLRRHFPDHRILLAAPAALAPLALCSGAVDAVLDTDRPETLRWPAADGPAVAVNLHGTGPRSHTALDATHPRRRIGCRAPGWDGPRWNDLERRHAHERERWCAVLAAHAIGADPDDLQLPPPPRNSADVAPVVIHPGARYGAKRWPADRFAALAAAFDRAGHRVLVTGSAAERPLARAVAEGAGLPQRRVLAGRTDLAQLATLVAHAAVLVCGDTGVAHLASAFRAPSVVLFGPVPPARWGPPADGHHIVLTDEGARRGDPFADDPDPALLGVTVTDVLAAAATVSLATWTERQRDRATVASAATAASAASAASAAGSRPEATATSRVVERPGR